MVMSACPLPAEFSWLSKTYRPSPQEVEAYAGLIAAVEGEEARSAEARRREAELQLWIWRAENRRRSSTLPRRPAKSRPDAA